jgi:type I restriction-modification system DNA methylase subunit/predicted type IV restriction endonuclease
MLSSNAIKRLVERFAQNISSYSASTYNETQLRREFLDPFFEALGWDVSNKQGYAEAYKEVIHEDAVKIGTATKAPDYSFRVGGTRKFFVEAKKPFINIKDDIDPAFQLRRYAWSAKLPLSILTDFQEFAVYDCRLKPVKTDKASIGRILYIKYDEFEKRWDEIASIFSKDSVLKGSFDRFADTNRAKKGTTEVDDVFLSEIEYWRDLLARNIAIRNDKLSSRELNFAVQRTIDRLIFLRICEDRGIEDYGRLQAHLNGENVYKRLCVLFREADERYNSGLFHFREEKGREETPDNITLNLDIDDKVLKQIIQNLYYPDSAYEFSVLPADILGQVYEQFLGKVIRLTAGHQAKVEDKPEVKKAGGVFYTPTYIVDYIVKNTVGKLLEDKTPRQAAALRILDPACGSGSFLIGAYQYLLDWHRDWYTRNDPEKWLSGKTPAIYKARAGEYRLSTPERKRILLNNIYGVDIDTQAVEVTKLSLLLKVLEGENEQTIAQQLKLFHERALPDLGNNIKCGNSLIGTDFYNGTQIGLFEDEEKFKINAFDWDSENGFQGIIKNGGFDAIIGNPPYIYTRNKGFTDAEKVYYDKFKLHSFQLHSFVLFLEQGYNLLKYKGFLSYIIPNNWLTITTHKSLRDFIIGKTKVLHIVNNTYKVFINANVDTSILTFSKDEPDNIELIESNVPNNYRKIAVVSSSQLLSEGAIQYRLYENSGLQQIINKINKNSVELQSIAIVKAGVKVYEVNAGTPPQTLDIKKNRSFHSTKKLNKNYRTYFDGRDVKRYLTDWSGEYVNYGKHLSRPRIPDLFIGERILVRQIPSQPPYSINAALVKGDEINDLNSIIIKLSDDSYSLLFFLGIINSKLISFWFACKFDKLQRAVFPQFKVNELALFPIRVINFSSPQDKAHHDHLVELANSMLNLHKKLPLAKTDQEKTIIQRQIESTDRRIDELVYQLYGLTEQEIKIVEETSERK